MGHKKILFCATVDYHFQAFHLPMMKWFKDRGWEVHVAASGNHPLEYTDKKYTIPIERSPFKVNNYHAYKALKSIMLENHYSIIHSHTPLGGVLARLAARTSRISQGTKSVYTAHGFHFCKGAPLKNWMLYYPVEWALSSLTDTLITINQEDFKLASSHHFFAKEIKHVHGVGVNVDRFTPISEKEKLLRKQSLGYHPNDCLLFYAAEFNKNKNQQLLLKVMAKLKHRVPHVKLLLAGHGDDSACKLLSDKLGIRNCVTFMGLRDDIDYLLPTCDLAVASSIREGLPVNIMEAMSCELPIVATVNRGHTELIKNGVNGWIIPKEQEELFVEKIIHLVTNNELRKKYGSAGRKMMADYYCIDQVVSELTDVYSKYMSEEGVQQWAVQ
ncbi:glycosyltransferase family 1 protein [Salipaludibacillus keqinensis]|uniref:Glycosyltransferase family 1 protein n=1 Tax=Salipaludibacillus keqinensis TaxID=2045207 RepID=A0A323TJW0_9BACI|nr:glycosyltransferase family 4 protein [Salipaludibacillus keqinensis]PYZ95069.1 glycosyltransferase family 1 protein [Salipaludibacillus keqinensis]